MAVYGPKPGKDVQSTRIANRPRLVFDEQHKFRIKNNRSLSHLQETRDFSACNACSIEADRRRQPTFDRPQSSCSRHEVISPPPPPAEQRPSTAAKTKPSRSTLTSTDLERLSRPKSVPPERLSNNCNWSNFIKKRSKYAIKTPYGLCDLTHGNENLENRPPFVNYGGRYSDKQHGQKRTFNSLAVHQLKHHEHEEQRLADVLRERRLRLQAENYFRETEERHAQAQDLHDRAARSSTEYRDNYRPPQNYNAEQIFTRP
ncbi:unnamed protein product [Adineta steineri]|uniref:Uncharacterized protein n=1 Tax=Adineta steineri TaxID=433720 RepID=A0A818Y6U0_9BILA|nr:unnamed protein product [Adineta steineri]CAF3750397.1 unnamed protein product [Adineta steineri]